MRAHSGWAVAVAVARLGQAPRVVLRKRIELIAEDTPKQPYHAAQSLNLKAAEKLIGHCKETVQRLAREELGALIRELQSRSFTVTGVGVLLASGRALGTLAQSLASHAAIHTAEGELFRNALIEAAKHWRLPVVPVKERELFDRSAEKLGRPVDEIRERIKEMGAQLGPPWRMDEKLSALLAWLVLAERPNT